MGRQVALESPNQREGADTQVNCISGNCCHPSTWPAKWDMDCIRCIYCPDDAAILARASQIRVESYSAIIFTDYLFTGGMWTTIEVSAGGFEDEGLIVMDADADCHFAALTLYHEVRHAMQPAGMTTYDAEVDAYTSAERWAIQKGLNDSLGLRMTDEFGNEIPSERAIHDTVMRYYFNTAPDAGTPPTEVVRWLNVETNETQWQNVRTGALEWRPSQEGDYMQTNDVSLTGPGVIDSSEFSCSG